MEKIKDKDISILLGNALRAGVYLSLIVVLIGSMIYLCRHGHEKNIFIGQKFVERDQNIADLLHDTFKGIKQGRGYYVIQLGVLLLLVTPLVRVILSLIAFAFERDRLYVIITAVVLFIITLSMLSGFGG